MEKGSFEKLIAFVYKVRWRYKKPLTEETTLEDDLGITGDDADDFMEAFFP